MDEEEVDDDSSNCGEDFCVQLGTIYLASSQNEKMPPIRVSWWNDTPTGDGFLIQTALRNHHRSIG